MDTRTGTKEMTIGKINISLGLFKTKLHNTFNIPKWYRLDIELKELAKKSWKSEVQVIDIEIPKQLRVIWRFDELKENPITLMSNLCKDDQEGEFWSFGGWRIIVNCCWGQSTVPFKIEGKGGKRKWRLPFSVAAQAKKKKRSRLSVKGVKKK
jgi:hypothetical protein